VSFVAKDLLLRIAEGEVLNLISSPPLKKLIGLLNLSVVKTQNKFVKSPRFQTFVVGQKYMFIFFEPKD
jgi:hypothetical protein